MNWQKLRKELEEIVQENYQGGAPIKDIRAALHAADLLAKQYEAIELLHKSKLDNLEYEAQKDDEHKRLLNCV